MKIAILGNYSSESVYSGSSIYNRQVIDHLLQDPKVEIRVFTASDWNGASDRDSRIHPIKTGYIPPFYSPFFIRRLMREVRAFRPDIVHAFSTEMPYASAGALLSRSVPVLLTMYGVAARETNYFSREYTAYHQHLYRWLTVLNERWAVRAVPHVVVDSESVLRYIRRWTEANIHVIPAGIEAEKIREIQSKAPDNGGPEIFLTVNLEQLKGVDLLIDAIARVRMQYPSVQAWIGGKGPQADALKSQIRSLGLEENVRLLGFISDEEKYLLYRSCGFVVVPSRWDCQPAALFEAAVSGKPVIASNMSNPGIVEDCRTGYHFHSEDVTDLAKKISWLLSNDRLRKEMGKRAYENAMEYDWKSVTSRYINIYYEILNRP